MGKPKKKLVAMKATERDWTPRRRGAIYCSPLCGDDCTWAAYLAAKARALDQEWRADIATAVEGKSHFCFHCKAIIPPC